MLWNHVGGGTDSGNSVPGNQGVGMRYSYVSIPRAGNALGGASLASQPASAYCRYHRQSNIEPRPIRATIPISSLSPQPTIAAIMSSQPPQEPAEQANPPQPAAAAGAASAQQPEEETGYAPLVDPRLPTRKDTSLKEFLAKIDDYAPIVSAYPPAPRLASFFPRPPIAARHRLTAIGHTHRSQTA